MHCLLFLYRSDSFLIDFKACGQPTVQKPKTWTLILVYPCSFHLRETFFFVPTSDFTFCLHLKISQTRNQLTLLLSASYLFWVKVEKKQPNQSWSNQHISSVATFRVHLSACIKTMIWKKVNRYWKADARWPFQPSEPRAKTDTHRTCCQYARSSSKAAARSSPRRSACSCPRQTSSSAE